MPLVQQSLPDVTTNMEVSLELPSPSYTRLNVGTEVGIFLHVALSAEGRREGGKEGL